MRLANFETLVILYCDRILTDPEGDGWLIFDFENQTFHNATIEHVEFKEAKSRFRKTTSSLGETSGPNTQMTLQTRMYIHIIIIIIIY